MTFDVIWKDHIPYINIDEFLGHLHTAQDTVSAWCDDVAPESTKIVCETIQVTIDTLLDAIKKSNPYD